MWPVTIASSRLSSYSAAVRRMAARSRSIAGRSPGNGSGQPAMSVREAVVGQELARPEDLSFVLRSDREPVGVLKEDRAQLPRFAQRFEPDPEPRVDLVEELLREVLRIQATLLKSLFRQHLAQL